MRDINEIKRIVTESRVHGVFNWNLETISSLINTIESQQEINAKQTEVFEKIKSESDKFMSLLNITFETHPTIEDQAKAYNFLVESQKEEIEKLKSYQVIKNYTDMLVECNSYKAITELAVKGLKMISRYPHYSDDNHGHSFQTVQREAVFTLSEIERLQNE